MTPTPDRRLKLYLLLAVAVLAVSAPPVAAQAAPTPSGAGEPAPTTPGAGAPAPTAPAENATGNASSTCAGTSGVGALMCRGVDAFAGNLIDKAKQSILGGLQQGTEGFVQLLTSRPLPLRNGHVEFVLKPTNQPLKAVYEIWWSKILPVALGVWFLYSLLLQFAKLLPSSMLPAAERQRLAMKSWTALGDMLLSWVQAAFVLVLSGALTAILAPSGEQIMPNFETFLATEGGVAIAVVLVYLSSGVLVVLLLLVWALGFLGPLVTAPLLPLGTALSLPDFWIFRRLTAVGEWLSGLFVPLAFMPVPTAAILGVGYPILNGINGVLSGPLLGFLGVPTYAVLWFMMWFAALVAPLFLLVGARKLRPFSAMAMGAIGAASAVSLARGGKAAGSAASSAASSASASTSGSSLALGSGRSDPLSSDSSPSPVPSGGSSSGRSSPASAPTTASASSGVTSGASTSSAPASSGSGGTPALGGTSGGATGSGSKSGAGSGSPSTPEGAAHVERPGDLPEGQQYEGGYYKADGEWQATGYGDPVNRDMALGRGYERISSTYDDKDVYFRGTEDGEVYDVSDVAGSREVRQADAARQAKESRGTVFDSTRSSGGGR